MEQIQAKIYGRINNKKNCDYLVFYKIDGEWLQVKSADGITAKFFKTEVGAKKYCEKKFNFKFID
jgi:hypothetical protein